MNDMSTSQLSSLLSDARRGSNDALAQLLESYRHYLALLARVQISQQLRGRVSSSDVVQETFLHAARAFVEFHGHTEAELVAWLRRILASEIINVARYHMAQRRDVRLEQRVSDATEDSSKAMHQYFSANCNSPSHDANQREQAVMLADALARLPDDYREIIVSRHFEYHSFPEIARRTGRTVSSVKEIWTRAVTRLRDELGEGPR